MNNDHYKRVLKVLDQIDRFVASRPQAGPNEAASEGDRLWRQEFQRGTKLSLAGANFNSRRFIGMRDSAYPFVGADLRNAALEKSVWWAMALDEAIFSGANLRAAAFYKCSAKGTNFRGADMSGVWFDKLEITDDRPADMTDAILRGAKIVPPRGRLILQGAELRGASVTFSLDPADRLSGEEKREYKANLERLIATLSLEQRSYVELKYKSGCFIATAACGHEDAPMVQSLCDFRDKMLRRHPAGKAFVSCYKTISPPLARLIAPRPGLRWIVRATVVKPSAWLAARFLKIQRRKNGRFR